MSSSDFHPLPNQWVRAYEGWGMVDTAAGYACPAVTREDVMRALDLARSTSRPLVTRGSGYSYGDVALLSEGLVLDMRGLDRVLRWDRERAVIAVEPGMTVRDLWRYVVADGWWPGVVPGAMYPTIGGCAALNIHGKNNWRAGAIGEWIDEMEVLLPTGDVVRCGPGREPELFHAVVGGLGVLAIILSVTLRLRKVETGLLAVRQIAIRSLNEMLGALDANRHEADYQVGWIDGFARDSGLGRGLLQVARYVTPGSTGDLALDPNEQDLPARAAGVIPRSSLWMGMKPLVNDAGMRFLNEARYRTGVARDGNATHIPLAQFHFFHDYVPNWKRSFRPGGILQYQMFVAAEPAERVFRGVLQASQRAGFYPYLAVTKLHRADRFLLAYNLDGYSLSLDFHATPSNESRLRSFLRRVTDTIVLPAGGRFYAAKDSILTSQQARQSVGAEASDRFTALKGEIDPLGLLQSNLSRRWFGW